MKTMRLVIYTPYGKYFDEEVDFLKVQSTNFQLGILPGHAPLISTLAISIMEITISGYVYRYSIGGGVINIDEEKITLMINSIERENEIDLDRALAAKKRAEERLKDMNITSDVDVLRAEAALKRANNRISLLNSNSTKSR